MNRLRGLVRASVRLEPTRGVQAFGCVLGFDWHSSGVTTTVTGALKEGVKGLERARLLRRRWHGRDVTEDAGRDRRVLRDAVARPAAPRLRQPPGSRGGQRGGAGRLPALSSRVLLHGREPHWAVVQQGMSDDSHTARSGRGRAPRATLHACLRARRQGRHPVSRRSSNVRPDDRRPTRRHGPRHGGPVGESRRLESACRASPKQPNRTRQVTLQTGGLKASGLERPGSHCLLPT